MEDCDGAIGPERPFQGYDLPGTFIPDNVLTIAGETFTQNLELVESDTILVTHYWYPELLEHFAGKAYFSGRIHTGRYKNKTLNTAFLDTQDVAMIEEIDVRTIREYAFSLRERNIDDEITASAAHNYFNYVRAFLSFCVRDELLEWNPADTHRATEYLPEDRGDRKRQFWTPKQRQEIIQYATKRVDMALEETIDVSREIAFRDRAIVVLLAEAGVRGAEIFRDSNDEAREGLQWSDVDLERKKITVFGKSRQYEDAALPVNARTALEQYRKVANPPIDEWPVFPTGHAPSKYRVLKDSVDKYDEKIGIDELLRQHEIAPPAITKEGGRQVMKRLSNEANIELEDGHTYLQPHGARRALGAELYESGHSELAQSALRHKSIETTHKAYSDIQAKDVADGIDDVRD